MKNTANTKTDIICMDTGEKLRYVTSVDVEQGIVWRRFDAPRMDLKHGDRLAEYPTCFCSIYPIHAGSVRQHLVHCYGRLNCCLSKTGICSVFLTLCD